MKNVFKLTFCRQRFWTLSIFVCTLLQKNPMAAGFSFPSEKPQTAKMVASLEELRQKFFPPEVDRIAAENKSFSTQCFALPSYNFGVVVNNDVFQIYRSQALGEKGVFAVFEHLLHHKLPQPDKVIFMNKDGYRKSLVSAALPFLKKSIQGLDNFAYQEALLFSQRGVFPEVTFFHPLVAPVYLWGRNPVRDRVSFAKADLIDGATALFMSKDHRHKASTHAITSTKDNLYYILELILGRSGPALFHCTGGLHRTGMVALAIRYLQGGAWTAPLATPIVVSQPSGGKVFSPLTLTNLAEVEYVAHNRYQGRQENLEAIRELAKEERFLALQQAHQADLNRPSRCSDASQP